MPRPTSTTTPFLAPGPTRGVLPDGTTFYLNVEPSRVESATGVSGGILIDLDDGTSPVAGILLLSRGPIESSVWDGVQYRIRTGADSVELDVYEHVIDELGPEYRTVFETGIIGKEDFGYQVLDLQPPFRWASDEEIPLQMEVQFEIFVVRRGCGELAVACSPTHTVQVIPSESLFAPAPQWPEGQQVWIESPGPRPTSDTWYLDPGPLGPRGAHDVVWTGEEMILWGGASGDRPPHLVEGAAFDPATNEWRLIPPPPIEPDQATRAIWVEDEMVLMSSEATLAYDPAWNTWRALGEGFAPAVYPGRTAVVDGLIYSHTPADIIELDPGAGRWRSLPQPEFRGFDRWRGALRNLDESLYVVGLDAGVCQGRLISRWSGTAWDPLPRVSLATEMMADCTYANQTAALDGRLIVWGDRESPAWAYDPDDGLWVKIEPTTLPGTEGPLGPVHLGDRFLVPQYGEGSIFDSATEQWTAVTLPGWGDDTEMVWTGEEVLMWGAACCYGGASDDLTSQDAWRWTPTD